MIRLLQVYNNYQYKPMGLLNLIHSICIPMSYQVIHFMVKPRNGTHGASHGSSISLKNPISSSQTVEK